MAILHIIHEEGKQEYQGHVDVTLLGSDKGIHYGKIFRHNDVCVAWKAALAFCLTEEREISISSDVDDFLMSGDKYGYDEETGLIYERE